MSTHGSRCNYDSKVGRHNNIGEAILTCGPRGPAGEGVGDEELDTAKRLRAGDAGVHGYNRSASPSMIAPVFAADSGSTRGRLPASLSSTSPS
jgi:hypothetical protein